MFEFAKRMFWIAERFDNDFQGFAHDGLCIWSFTLCRRRLWPFLDVAHRASIWRRLLHLRLRLRHAREKVIQNFLPRKKIRTAGGTQCRRKLNLCSTRRVCPYSSGGKVVSVGDSVSFKIVLASACKARQRGQSS